MAFTVLASSLCFAGDMKVYVGSVPPFTIVGPRGEVTGAAVDVVSRIMELAGSPIDVAKIKHINWARAVEETETQPDSMIFCMAKTPQRESKFKWVGPIAHLKLGLIARTNASISIEGPDDLKKYEIGAIRNSAPAQILEKGFGIYQEDMTLLPNDLLQFKMLNEGRVDLITQADTAAPSWIKELGFRQEHFEMVYVLKKLDLYLALNRETSDDLVSKAQSELQKLKETEDGKPSWYDLIMQRYLFEGPIALRK